MYLIASVQCFCVIEADLYRVNKKSSKDSDLKIQIFK